MGNNEWNAESTFGERLEDLIKEKGVKYQEVGDAIGVNKSQISKWCSGNCDAPGAKKVIALAKYFNVTSDYLLGLSNVKTNQNVEIDQLGLNAEAIEWLKLLYTSANDLYNRKQQEAQRYLIAVNKILDICFSAENPVELIILDLFYSAFFENFNNIVLPDGSNLSYDPEILLRIMRDKIKENEEFYHLLGGTEYPDDVKAFYIADSIENKASVSFRGEFSDVLIHIRANIANEESFDLFIDKLKNRYKQVRIKTEYLNKYSEVEKNKSVFSDLGLNSSAYMKVLEDLKQDLYRSEKWFDDIDRFTAMTKESYINAIELANLHDSEMTPDEWFDYCKKNCHIKLKGDSDGNI